MTAPPVQTQTTGHEQVGACPLPFARSEPTTARAPSSTARPSSTGGASRSAQVLAYVDVIHALCDLARVERAALRLIYWQGRSQEQVAAELRLPIATVRAAVAHGMAEIATRLTDR